MTNKIFNLNNIALTLTIILYSVLGILTINSCYFWDVTQHISNEAHWYYLSNFASFLMPYDNNFGLHSTGCHPPLLPIVTAFLWKILGYHLWVSHLLSIIFAAIFLYNLYKTVKHYVPQAYAGLTLLLLSAESAVITQFAIASPDFIMLAAFVLALRGIIENKNALIVTGSLLLALVNMRGVFMLCTLAVANFYYNYNSANKQESTVKCIKRTIIPYLPVITLLVAYFTFYFWQKGWFFTN